MTFLFSGVNNLLYSYCLLHSFIVECLTVFYFILLLIVNATFGNSGFRWKHVFK